MGVQRCIGLIYPPRPIRIPSPELFESKTILRIAHSAATKAHLVPISSLSSPMELRSLCANISGTDTNVGIMYWYPTAKIWVNVCWMDPTNMEEFSFVEMMDTCEGINLVDVFVIREGDCLPDLN